MIFVDSNIPMYLVGAHLAAKERAQDLLERATLEEERLITDAEVLQEILHRYTAIDRREAIQPAFAALLDAVETVYPIERTDIERAKGLVLTTRRLSARVAVHVAVMQRHGVERIMSFDRGFDGIPGLVRVDAVS